MFLEWIQALNFLTKTDEEGIFLVFPTASRRTIAKEVTEVLLKGNALIPTIKSNVNVKVLMECVGQCFGLPIHDCADIIAAATELYRRWLFEPELRPAPITANQDLFFLEILKHSSLIFQPRAGIAKEVLPTHVKLCESVLEVYRRMAKDVAMTKYLWERFIEIIISIADFLLKKKVEEEPLADRLTPNILRTLFEVFLMSHTKNDKLWDALKSLLNEWRHRRPVILQWNAMCLGLTARAVRLLYGPSVGADTIHFMLEEVPSSQFIMPDDYTLYAWARILYLLGDLELIPTGPNYADTMKGIQALTNYLISVKLPTGALMAGTTPAPFRTPDGNTVLKVVGHWIFEAINNYKQQGYEKGKAYALETACVLFCSKSRTVFNARYLAFLYRGLEEAMKLRHPALSAVIVMNLTSFFPNEFPGCNVLIPSLVYTVARILLEVGTSNAAQLRKSCIRLIGTLLCYPNTYSGITFKHQSSLTFTYQGYAALAPIAKYDDIAEHFGRSLLESLRTEEDSDNKQMLIYTLLLHVLENMNFDMSFVFKVVAVLVEKIGIVWGPENIHHALIALSQIANVYHLFQHVENSEAVAAHVVAELCKFIERYYTPGIKKEFIEDVVVEAFFCIIDWILQPNQWLLHSSKIVMAVLGCIEIATTGRKTGATGTYHPSTARAREAGEYLLYYLLNQFGQFPPPTGPTSMSTPMKEPELMAADNLTSKNVQCFIFDKTLISVVSYPRNRDAIELALLMRDQSGRYHWNVSLNLFPTNAATPADPPGDTDAMLPPPLAPQEADDEFLQELGSFLDDNALRMHDAILRQASDRAVIEDNHLVQTNYGLSPNVSVVPPTNKFDAVPARLFLSQAGFLSLDNRFHFQSLQVSASRPFNLLQNFKNLDHTPQRECFAVRPDPWETMDATRNYFEFIRHLGWEVELVSHAGFLGGLDPLVTGETAPYWSNHLFEMIFYVSTMMPNGDPAQMQATKKRLINGAPVLITWVEDGEDLDGTTNLSPDQWANIVIIPLRSGLYRVKVFKKAGFGFFGPLLSDVVVSRHILPYTVRATAIQACRLAAKASPNLRPLSQRKFIIEDFKQRNTVSVPLSKLYGAQFALV